MLRLIRWLCFPIARQFGWRPIAVYFGLVLPLIVARRLVWPLPPEAAEALPSWFFPTLYAFVLIGLPLLFWLRNRDWYRVQRRGESA